MLFSTSNEFFRWGLKWDFPHFLILVENKSWAFVEIQSSDTRRGVGQTLCSHLCNAIKRTLDVYDGVIAKMENVKLKCLEIHCFFKNTA